MTSRLQTQQQALWRAVRYDPAPPDTLSHFRGDDRLDASARLAIYRNMYWFRQINALGETFPRLHASLGEEAFAKLAQQYLRHHPSTRPALEHLGRSLPTFLRALADPDNGNPPTKALAGILSTSSEMPSPDVLADLAELEWQGNLALLAPDSEGLASPDDCATPELPSARIAFVPSLRGLQVRPEAWQRFLGTHPRDDESTTLDTDAESAPRLNVAFWRKRFGVRQRVLGSEEVQAFALARAGAPIAECLNVFSQDNAGITAAFAMLRGWFAQHWIEAIHP